ncbi:hypothetical protein PVAND_004129 [Polypedilum vanderplanki]|uniref:Uncharacterized protein n=1 Tax=Polypedilum vanderplanki TaxID=319348 RepID=A0A9J6BWS1_POLVA|nr:hypothetical protein PVAND_004129 [Polypedilum vanderplanki]
MYQAKRDFRDPRKIEKLCDFLYNESPQTNCDAANGKLQITREQKNGLEISNERNCVSQIKVLCSCDDADKDLLRSKSMMCKKACNGQLPEGSINQCFRENPHECESYKFRISDFPTQIDRFVPRDSLNLMKQTTEYQDEFDRVASIIFKHNIHDHSRCRNGQKCEHIIKPSKIQRRRQL